MESLKPYRFKDNPQEKIFYDKWMERHISRFHSGYSMVDYLLAKDPNRPNREATDRDELVAVTIIQWLGSPVGMSFLEECGFVRKYRTE